MTDTSPQSAAGERPVVALPRTALRAWVFAAACAVLAAGLFIALDARRHALSAPAVSPSAARPDSGFAAPPTLVVPPPPEPAPAPAPPPVVVAAPQPRPAPPPPAPVYTPRPPITYTPPTQPVMAPPQRAQPQGNLGEPALVVDLTPPDAAAAPGAPGGNGPGAPGDDAAARATVIRNRATLIPQGTLIAAALETPIDSTRPGLVRAVVSRDARGFDGTRLLIPRGSRLIGEYRSDIQSGQKRVLVQWTRLIRPDGVAIRIGSPAADALGSAGIPGQVNTHFFARFASAVLQSALTVGVNLASRPGNGSVIVGVPSQVGGQLGQALLPGTDLKPTIKVRQGADIMVFVARDLDFAGASPRP